MDTFHVKRLKEEHQKGLYFCEEKIKKWENFKTDYEALMQRLTTLPDCLSYDVTVPFGNNAFTKGKIVHTNEIMVLLGDNWFVEVSAKQALSIAKRRIAQCINMLEELHKEKQQFENWLNFIGEVSGNDELVEIVEDYDEERENMWKEQHAMNVKSYRQQIAKEKEEENEANDSYDECISKLDTLELAEVNGKINYDEDPSNNYDEDPSNNYDEDPSNNYDEDPSNLELPNETKLTSTTDCSDDGSHSEEHPERNGLKLHLNCNFRKTSESETGEDYEDIRKRDVNSDGHESTSPKNGKHVRWQDLSKQNIKKITFKHSKPKKPNTPISKYKVIDSSEDENHPLIQSPSDIYKRFGDFFQSSPPKSILKVKSPSPSTDMNGPIFPTKDFNSKESSPETDESNSSPFTGVVHERSSPINIVETKFSRPTSHFKSSRKNRKR